MYLNFVLLLHNNFDIKFKIHIKLSFNERFAKKVNLLLIENINSGGLTSFLYQLISRENSVAL